MQSIINEIIEIINTNDTLLDIEVTLDHYLNSLWSELLSKAFERIDLELIAQHKEKGYEIDRIEKRTIQFSLGPVELKRRRLHQKGKKSFIPLDKELGLDKYKRYSPLVEMKASVLATDLVYRKAADTMSLLTPLTISHGAIHSIVQRVGKHIQKWVDHIPTVDDTSHHKKKKVPVIFIEGDGLMLKGGKSVRPDCIVFKSTKVYF